MGELDTWTVKQALDWTCGYLERKGDENPRVSAEWLIAEACGLSRIEIYMGLERPLSADERAVLRDYVQRRGRGEPLQYIAGETAFRYITVRVRPGVLIPRPETEVLVSEALACLPAARKRAATWSVEAAEREAAALSAVKQAIAQLEGRDDALWDVEGAEASCCSFGDVEASPTACDGESRCAFADGESVYLVADICTGSGCIACSVAAERHDARVLAVDIAPEAVALARENVEALGLKDRVAVLQGDLGEPVPARFIGNLDLVIVDIAPEAVALARENVEALGLKDRVAVLQGDLGEPVPARFIGNLDLVISNPPYVPTAVLSEIPREVSAFEPALALDGGDDGLDFARRLLPWCKSALKPGGSFAFELHEGHLDCAADLARSHGFEDVRVVEDLAGRPRVLLGRKPNPAL